MGTDYKICKLWASLEGKCENDADKQSCKKLSVEYEKFWKHATEVAQKISNELPGLTLHDERHFVALWERASLLVGPNHDLNPLEIFVLGGAILIHDIGHTVAVYEGGINEVKNSVEYCDAMAIACPEGCTFTEKIKNQVMFTALRTLHAKQAEQVLNISFSGKDCDDIYLLEDEELRSSLGHCIGQVAASHHWNRAIISATMNQRGAPASFNSDWTIRTNYLALILRCADAIQIDESRATNFSRALHRPEGESSNHWLAQSKIVQPTISANNSKVLEFQSTSPFTKNEISAWWVAFDLIRVAHDELVGSAQILSDLGLPEFHVNRVAGADDPKMLSQYIKVDGWEPVLAEVRVADVDRIINLFGGAKLYGRNPRIPIRESIQNAADAIMAMRLYRPTEIDQHRILVASEDVGDEYIKIIIADTGIGMSKSVLTGALLEFGKSMWNSDDIQSEFPGLASKKPNAVGQYGIGFYSNFMIAKEIRVISKGLDQSDVFVLEFKQASKLKPVLLKGNPDDLGEYSTKIELIYDKDDFDQLLQVTSWHDHKKHEQSLSQIVGQMCPTVDCDIHTKQDQNKVEKSHSVDWTTMDGKLWLNQISAAESLGYSDDIVKYISDASSRLDLIKDSKGIASGRAAISFGKIPTGNYTIGGFANSVPFHMNERYVGSLPLISKGPSRIDGEHALNERELSKWATGQALKIAKLEITDRDKLQAAFNVVQFFGNPEPIAFAFLNRKLVDLEYLLIKLKENGYLNFVLEDRGLNEGHSLGQLMNRIGHASWHSFDTSDIEFVAPTIEGFGSFDGKIYYQIFEDDREEQLKYYTFMKCFRTFCAANSIKTEARISDKVHVANYVGETLEKENLQNGKKLFDKCLTIKSV